MCVSCCWSSLYSASSITTVVTEVMVIIVLVPSWVTWVSMVVLGSPAVGASEAITSDTAGEMAPPTVSK